MKGWVRVEPEPVREIVLTDHARERCAEMGVSTREVKRAMQHPTFSHRVRTLSGQGKHATLSECGRINVIHDGHVVLTVTWSKTFTREEGDQSGTDRGARRSGTADHPHDMAT